MRAARRLLLALALAGLVQPAPVDAEDLRTPVAATRAIDLTHPLYDAMPFWPGGVPFRKTRLVDYEKGYRLHKFEMGENTGTHVDAPSHFIRGKLPIDGLALRDLVVPAVVIDATARAARNPTYQLTAADIRGWEAANGRIGPGTLVILNTGWHRRFASPDSYVNMDANGIMRFPGFHPDAAPLLIARGVAGVGIDTLSLDFGPSKDFAFHVAILRANRYQIENLANLDALPARGATAIVGVLPVRGGSQAQARVIALLP